MADYLSDVRSQAQKAYQTQLKDAVTERFQENPLFKQREQAYTKALSAPSQIRSDIAEKVAGGTILSPSQQLAMESAGQASAFAPLTSLNQIIDWQTGQLEGGIDAASRAAQAEAAMLGGQATAERNLLNDLLGLYKEEESRRRWEAEQAASGGTGGMDLATRLKLFGAIKPSATMQGDAIQGELGLQEVANLKTLLGSGKSGKILKQQQLGGGLGRLFMGQDAKSYQDTGRELYDILMRSRTGAAMNMNEEQFYKQYIPNFTDNKSNIDNKLNRLENLFNVVSQAGQQPTWLLPELSMLQGGLSDEWEVVEY